MLEERGQLHSLSNPILPSPDKSWDTPPHCYLIFKHKISCIQLQRTRLFVFQIFNEIFIFCSRCSSWKSIDGGENPIRQLSTTLISPKVSWSTMSLQHRKINFSEWLAQNYCIRCLGQTKLSFCQFWNQIILYII